jgi:hypothetical protein
MASLRQPESSMFVSSSPPIGRRRNREQSEEDISQPDLPPHSKSVRPNTLVPNMHTFRRSPRKHPSGNQRIATSSLAQLRQAHQTAPPLPKSTSYWFKKKLFTVSWIKPDHKKLQMGCTQPNCNYTQDTANNKIGGSGNLVRHYESKHRSIPATDKADKAQEPQRVISKSVNRSRAPGVNAGLRRNGAEMSQAIRPGVSAGPTRPLPGFLSLPLIPYYRRSLCSRQSRGIYVYSINTGLLFDSPR